MDAFYAALESVLNINSEQAKTLVANFNSGDLAFFQTYFDALPTAKLQTTTNVKDISANTTLFIETYHIGEGGYGTVFKNRTQPYVYKFVTDYNRVNNKNSFIYLKTNFKEAIIQTLLQSDPTYGKNVCSLYKVYRNGVDFVFQLEPLETTLEKYMYTNRDKENLPEIVEKILFKLILIINHFYVTYGFNQGDAGTSNTMTVNSQDFAENLKLIDFGGATITALKVGKPTQKRTSTKSLYAVLKYNLRESNRKLFAKLVKLPPETPVKTLTNILQAKTKKGGATLRKTRKTKRQTVTHKIEIK
jgi:hypothetical protein